MTHLRRQFGDRGEDLALSYFLRRGYTLVDRNWSCRLGEIDLILQKGETLHFVEVKTRHTLTYGYPEESITGKKLCHLARAIELYLEKTRRTPKDYCIDALAIIWLPGTAPEFYFIERIL